MQISYIAITLAITAVVMWLVALIDRKAAKTPLGFFQAGRNLGSVSISGTYIATSLALANAIFYFLWLGFTAGLVGIWIQVAWIIGFFVLALYLPKILRASGHHTFHDYLSHYYGLKLGLLASIVSFSGLALNFGYEIIAGATLIRAPESTEATAFWSVLGLGLAISFITVVYSKIGGFASIVRTDVWQWLLSTTSLILLLWVMVNYIEQTHGLGPFLESHSGSFNPFNWDGMIAIGGGIAVLSNVAFSVPWQICDMTSWQKISASDPERQQGVKLGIIFSGIFLLIIPGLIVLLIGIMLRGVPAAEVSLLNALVETASGAGPLILILILLGFFAAQMSTADTFLLGAVQALAVDALGGRKDAIAIGPSDLNAPPAIPIPVERVKLAKMLLPIVAFASVIGVAIIWKAFGLDNDALFNVVYVVYSLQLSLAFPMLFALSNMTFFLKGLVGWLSISGGIFANIWVFVASQTGHSLVVLGAELYSISAMPLVCLLASAAGAGLGGVLSSLTPSRSLSRH